MLYLHSDRAIFHCLEKPITTTINRNIFSKCTNSGGRWINLIRLDRDHLWPNSQFVKFSLMIATALSQSVVIKFMNEGGSSLLSKYCISSHIICRLLSVSKELKNISHPRQYLDSKTGKTEDSSRQSVISNTSEWNINVFFERCYLMKLCFLKLLESKKCKIFDTSIPTIIHILVLLRVHSSTAVHPQFRADFIFMFLIKIEN